MNKSNNENQMKENKIIVYFIVSIIFFIICFSIFNIPYNHDSSSSSSSNSNSMINYQNNNQDSSNNNNNNDDKLYRPELIKMKLDKFNGMSKQRDILSYSDDLLNDYYIGINSFLCSLMYEDIIITPSSLWSIILSDLVESIKYDKTNIGITKLDNNNNIKVTESFINDIIRNANITNDQRENELIQFLSSYIDPSFKSLLFTNFTTSKPKDNLIFLGELIGERIVAIENNVCLDNNLLLNSSFTLSGTIDDYKQIQNKIELIYNYIDQAINNLIYNSNKANLIESSKDLFSWYKYNSYYINNILQSFSEIPSPPTQNHFVQLNRIIEEYIYHLKISNGRFNPYHAIYSRGYKTINFLIDDVTQYETIHDDYDPPFAVPQLLTGHMGSSLVRSKDQHKEITLATPNIDWLLSIYHS